MKVDAWFRHAEADLHNLFPAAGELNGDRKDKPYGDIPGEERRYGVCDFEVSANAAEPREEVRGELARAILFMDRTYGPFLTDELRQRYQAWSDGDPPDDWELERERRIEPFSK